MISFERWVAIKYPLRFDVTQVKKRLPFIILFTWVLGFVTLLTIALSSTVKNGECSVESEYPSNTIRLLI